MKKLLLFLTLFLVACTNETMLEESIIDSSVVFTYGVNDLSRVTNTGYWLGTRSITDFNIPELSGIIINNLNDVWNIPNNYNGDIFVNGVIDNFTINNAGKVTVYITKDAVVNWLNLGTGNITVYTEGIVTFGAYVPQSNNITDIYNKGYIKIGTGSEWINLSSGHNIYSDDIIEIDCNTVTLESNIEASKLIVNGNLKIQTNSTIKDICEILCSGDIEVVTDLNVGKLTALSLRFDGANIQLLPNGYIKANTINMPNSNCVIKVSENSVALVECKELTWLNNTLESKFGIGVYLNVEKINGHIPTSEDLISLQDGINNSNIHIEFVCGAEGDQSQVPSLDEIATIESPSHNHNEDKSARHLSASSLTIDDLGNIYASYHMRGSNWGNDSYDKDDVEGCIEYWYFDGNLIELGNWVWTYDFDFNHIIYDDNKVIAVGHKDGGIVTWFSDFDFKVTPSLNIFKKNGNYRYLITNNRVNGEWENAGDGNCIIPYKDGYIFAASKGYGMLTSSLDRYFENELPVFTETPGSAKHISLYNNEYYINYLDLRFNPAKLTDVANMYFKHEDSVVLAGTVNPVDGKNVMTVDESGVYVCLGNTGLYINGDIYTFHGPVNGVATDDKYIYVCNGSYITVLHKDTKELYVERKAKSSSNFVVVLEYNGNRYVFVAFGQEGIKVYRLNDSY